MTLTIRLGELCQIVKGTFPTLKTEPGPYPLVVTAAFRRTAKDYQVEGPAVCIPLISSTGHGDAAIHRLHYQEGKFALANLLVALLPKDLTVCHTKYLYYYLNSKKDELFVPLMLGTANVSLKERDIASVEIGLPPLAEQRRLVERIEALAAKIEEAKRLREEVSEGGNRLLISMAHRNDLCSQAKGHQGWKEVAIADIVQLVSEPHQVRTDTAYPNLGIYSFGRGLFKKPPIEGLATSAKTLFRVKAGQFIYSRLFAFEGAYGTVTQEYDGCFVSNEYPTFACDPSKVHVSFLGAYFKSRRIWEEVATGSKGLGDRRQRVHPDQILRHRLWLPPMEWQDRIAAVEAKMSALEPLHSQAMTELDALLPAILDRAFRGEL